MSGERDLAALLAGTTARLDPDVYVFVTGAPADEAALMRFEESEGTTQIVLKRLAEARGWTYAYPCRRITLEIHSALEAVGYLAAISRALAQAAISCNAVSAFYHDHIFVAEADADRAIAVIERLAR